jgi:hypothetical protein
MEVLTCIGAWVLTFLANVLGNVIAHDLSRSSPALCEKLIRFAAKRLAKEDRALYEEQWLADLADQDGIFSQFHHALGCVRCCRQLAREASIITIRLFFRGLAVNPVIVTYRFSLHGPFARLAKRSDLISRYILLANLLPYFFLKRVLAVRHLSSKDALHFLVHWKQIRDTKANAVILSNRNFSFDLLALVNGLKGLSKFVTSFKETMKKGADISLKEGVQVSLSPPSDDNPEPRT